MRPILTKAARLQGPAAGGFMGGLQKEIVLTLPGFPDPALAIAASRAGALGVMVFAFLRASAFTEAAPAAPVLRPVAGLPSITQMSAQVLASNRRMVPMPLGTPCSVGLFGNPPDEAFIEMISLTSQYPSLKSISPRAGGRWMQVYGG